MYVDVHVHLDHPAYADDLDAVIVRAKKAGVVAILTQGVHHEVNEQALAIARRFPSIVRPALGLYPCNALNVQNDVSDEADGYKRVTTVGVDETLSFIRTHTREIAAIGEVGLDFKFSSDREHQSENFRKIIALARELKKSLIIHSRKAEKEVVELLERSGIPKQLVVLHCFSGNKKLIGHATKLGYTFSIPCNITRSQHFQMLAMMVPITQLLTETDGPYLPPDGSTRSEPAHVANTVKKIAELKGIDEQETAQNIFMNYQRLFL